jgi:hypothetical protein
VRRVLDRLVDVGVVEDDGGRLAAELEHDLLQVALGRHLLDEAAGAAGAGEGQDADVHVAAEHGARGHAVAAQHVEHTGREPGLLDELADAGGREGRLLAALEHDGVAGDEGGRRLAGEEEQRHVPGDDGGDDAVRLAQRHGHEPRGVQAGLALDLRPRLGVVVVVAGRRECVDVLVDGAAHALRLERRQLRVVGAQQAGQLLQVRAALRGLHRRPGREGGLGGGDGGVGIVLGGFGDLDECVSLRFRLPRARRTPVFSELTVCDLLTRGRVVQGKRLLV